MGRKAESSYLKSSQVRRNLFFLPCLFLQYILCLAFMMAPKWPHSLRRGLQRHSSEIMRTDQHWASRWQTQLNPAPDTCNTSQEVCVISVQQSLAFVNNFINLLSSKPTNVFSNRSVFYKSLGLICFSPKCSLVMNDAGSATCCN